jgi:16S rRNA (cytosine1402-N4)-methyltransferase
LLKESVDGLSIKPNGTYVDLTFGGGGHSREILKRLENGRLIVFDQDQQAYHNKPDDERLIFVRHNFRYLSNFLSYLNISDVDGILGDLGVSSHHFDAPERGFSFRYEGALDMRMSEGLKYDAAHILNHYDDARLVTLFRNYGELKNANRLVKEIIASRHAAAITTTTDLKNIAEKVAPRKEQTKFLAKVFQALRIEVNQEMAVLKELLVQVPGVLKKKGRLVIISYHSLEDRLVKNFMKTGDCEKSSAETDLFGQIQTPFKVISRKVMVPSEEEIERNSRARSAKLRIAEKR